MKSSVAKPMETVAESEASAEMPSLETVAVESVPKLEPGLGGGDHSE